MCLAVIAWNTHPRWKLVVVANRDEYHGRPATAMRPWDQMPSVLAGRDIRAGGTWLGVRPDGRFALLTNYRDPTNLKPTAPSRGKLVENFLLEDSEAVPYLNGLSPTQSSYNGFNLLVSDSRCLAYASNRTEPFSQPIASGVYGLSNALLNTPWPKTQKTVNAIRQLLTLQANATPEDFIAVMRDTNPVSDDLLPSTGIGLDRERLLATPFIISPSYGTRCTTLILQDADRCIWVQEDSYNADGALIEQQRWCSADGGPWKPFQVWPGSL
jgi:uncharacterized protein with NRDE domain